LLALVHSAAAETAASHSGVTSSGTASKAGKKVAKHKDAKHKDKSSKKAAAADVPVPRARPGASTGAEATPQVAAAPPVRRISPSKVPLAQAPTPETSDADITLVKEAIDAVRSTGASEATRIEAQISDPVARKLVEWIILRDGDNGAQFSRYAAFIAANQRPAGARACAKFAWRQFRRASAGSPRLAHGAVFG
jgi:soluble lytic murein transglycosylase